MAGLWQTHGAGVRVKRHTVSIGAFEPNKGDIIVPGLALVLPVNDDAFRTQGALKVVLFLGVIVTKA